jgi:hypothetical protein
MPVKLRLLAELQRAADGTAPCMTTDPHLWVSDNWLERRTAAHVCLGCPVFDRCRAAAEAEPVEVWGVWAGREILRRHRRPRAE